jgi:hypothetical protein
VIVRLIVGCRFIAHHTPLLGLPLLAKSLIVALRIYRRFARKIIYYSATRRFPRECGSQELPH